MKYVRFLEENIAREGIIQKGSVIEEITGNIYDHFQVTGKKHDLEKVKLLSPCSPTKVICVGLNYKDHAREMQMPLPKEPIIFLKPAETVIGPDEEIIYPIISKQVDYEAELAIIIKNKIRDIGVEEALSHIFGYTCANDVTARDLQKKDGQWSRAKSFDTFCPLGPWVITDLDTNNLEIKLLLNGVVKQQSSTKEMIFSPAKIVSFISQITTLNPGDVIITGTPAGIGTMQKGDKVEVFIEKIGKLSNRLSIKK